mmetsp:Transcript_8941/g.11058  ORF Transcript_8941/g.11058 Transcript_8941/m.11058 type:complete len:98 (-) Transcript_8941:1076-1369(-)
MIKLLFVFIFFCSLGAATNCPGTPNLHAISVDAPIFVNSTDNGKYFVQNSVSPPLAIVHVYGTPYEMGFAQGVLLKDQLNSFYPEVCLTHSNKPSNL